MAPRLELQALLVSFMKPEDSENVYFQPPPSVSMHYPAIVYNRDRIDIAHADNLPYQHKHRYQITVIDRDPDSEIPDRITSIPTVAFDRFFVSDDLNHFVFNLFF